MNIPNESRKITKEIEEVLQKIRIGMKETQKKSEQVATKDKTKIKVDFKEIKEKQDAFLTNTMEQNLEEIESLEMANYTFSEPETDLKPLWGKITSLNLSANTMTRASTRIYTELFESMHSLEKIKLRNIIAERPSQNICDDLPNNIRQIDYKIGEDLNWCFVIRNKPNLTRLRCEMKPTPPISFPIGKLTQLDVEINPRNLFTYVLDQMYAICKIAKGEHLLHLTIRTSNMTVARELIHKLPQHTRLNSINLIELKENNKMSNQHIPAIKDRLQSLKGIENKKLGVERPEKYLD